MTVIDELAFESWRLGATAESALPIRHSRELDFESTLVVILAV